MGTNKERENSNGGKESKNAASAYSKYSLNMLVFFVVLWGASFLTILYTADVRRTVPQWVEDLIQLHSHANSNDTYEAQGNIYTEHSFSYSIFDRRQGVPLKVDFTESPDEDFLQGGGIEAGQAGNLMPHEAKSQDDDMPAEGETDRLKVAGPQEGGESLIQLKEVIILETDNLPSRMRNGKESTRYYSHVNIDDLIVKKGEMLFYKKAVKNKNGRESYHRVFTPAFYRLLAYERTHTQLSKRHGNVRILLMNWLLAGMVMLALGFCLFSWRSNIFESVNELALCGVCLLIHILGIMMAHAVFKRLDGGPTFYLYALMPMALGPALVSNMIGKRVGLCAAILLSTLTPLIVDDENLFQLFIIALSYSIIGVLAFNNVRKRKNFVAGGAVIIVVVMILCLMYVYKNDIRWVWEGFSPFWNTVAIYVSINALLTIVALFLLPFLFEMVFRVTTSITFNELCNGDHKLLERLRDEAPGTYEHSIAVARLASAAAKAIGANSKMAEACALFHDIGKLSDPKNFAENLLLGEKNPHDTLSPLESCAILRHHVSYGLELAAKAHLPLVIREAIGQHHGSSVMAGFFAKACAETKVNEQKAPDVMNYSYMGELPWRKEVVLVAIADFCEATIRSCMQVWDNPSYDLIFKKVVELIQDRLREHQFDKANIQINELNTAIHELVDVFCSKYHLRPQYETTEQQVEKMLTRKGNGTSETKLENSTEPDMPSEPDMPASEDAQAKSEITGGESTVKPQTSQKISQEGAPLVEGEEKKE